MKHRHLRKWVYQTAEAITALIVFISLVFCYSIVIEALTGINPVMILMN